MEPISLEDFLVSRQDSPGARLHRFRLLNLLASASSQGANPVGSYDSAKNAALQLQIDTAAKLKNLFENAALGNIDVAIDDGQVSVSIQPLPAGMGASAVKLETERDCNVARGLIDGALQIIVGAPVQTKETSCIHRGDDVCLFQAVAETHGSGYCPADSSSPPRSAEKQEIDLKSWFVELTMRELARMRRHKRQLSLLYIDIDDLGKINSRYGRPVGDSVINAVWKAIFSGARQEDFLWHHGEDEFAMVLSETNEKSATIAAQRIASQIRASAGYIDVAAKVSASIGVATFPTHAQDVAGLFSRARAAVYLAKAKGKANIESASILDRKTREDTPLHTGDDRRKQGLVSIKDESPPALEISAASDDSVEETGEGRNAGGGPASERSHSVAIASASPFLLAGMKQALASLDNFHVCAEVAHAPEILGQVEDLRPDLILIDFQLAASDEFAAVRAIRSQNLATKVVVISDEVEPDLVRLVLDFSVEGIVFQSADAPELTHTLETVYEGRASFPEKIRAAIAEMENKRRLLKELSERELEVLRLVAEGKSNSQISGELFITVNTVRFHLANIYQKLSVSNRTEAANYFLRQDLSREDQGRLL